MTFGGELNYTTERIIFDVAEIPLPYNGILGRPALAKFMAASHYAYNMLKMPGPMNVITVPSDKKDALVCADQLYREAVAAAAAKALAPAAEAPGGKKKPGKTSRTHSGKRTSLECFYCRGRARELYRQEQEIQSRATADQEGVRQGGRHGRGLHHRLHPRQKIGRRAHHLPVGECRRVCMASIRHPWCSQGGD